MQSNIFKIKLFAILFLVLILPFPYENNTRARQQNSVLEKFDFSADKGAENGSVISFERRKSNLNKKEDLTTEQLIKVRNRIVNMPNLPSELKNRISKEIDSRIEELINEKEKISDLKTIDEIKIFLNEARQKNKEIKKIISDEISNKIKERQLSSLILKLDKILENLDQKSKVLKKSGIDVSGIKEDIDFSKLMIENIEEKINSGNYSEAAEMIKNLRDNFRLLSEKLNKK